MRRPHLNIKRARGFLLIVAILVLVVVAVAVAALGNMTSADIRSSSGHAQSEQAYFAATSGLEFATRLLKSGTACGALPTAATAVGAASVTLSRTLNNPASTTVGGAGVATTTATTIPATSTVGYGAHGRIVIDGEQIRYTGITATSFTGATRGYGGTTAATHLAAATVLQNQCLVQATGTSGVATRVMQSAIQSGLWSDFLDDGITAVPLANGTLHTLNAGSGLVTVLPAGNNIIIAIVALRNTSGTIRTITGGAPGNLRLRNVTTATTLASNLYGINVGGAGAPSLASFNQKTFFFVHRETAAAANQTYRIEGFASGAGVTAEVKIVVINGPPVSSSQITQSANAGNGAFSNILTHTPVPPYPAGDNIVIAAVQWNNTAGGNRTINATNLQLVRGVATLASNTFPISVRTGGAAANDNGGMLLVGRDTSAPANPTYVVQANATGAGLQLEAKLIVISAVGSAYFPGGVSIPLNASPTPLGPLNTSFPALRQGATNIAVAATQYDTSGNAARSILATNEGLVFDGSPQAWNEFTMDLCATGIGAQCTDFAMGLIGRQTIADASPSFDVKVTPSSIVAPVLNGEAKILGVHLTPVTDRIEVLP